MTRSESLTSVLPAGTELPTLVLDRLCTFEDLVRKWNPTINVVSKSTIPDLWQRHVLDSAQIFRFAPRSGSWVDLGSGGGFPGIVVAILAESFAPELKVTLVESDRRKAVFLKEACRQLEVTSSVLSERIDELAPLMADVISARALAPLEDLCAYAFRHLAPNGTAVFLKGQQSEEEIAAARKKWSFKIDIADSATNPDAKVLALREVQHVER